MPDRALVRVGYGVALLIGIDQVAQLAGGYPFDPTVPLARFQVANLVAPRLVLLVLANTLVAIVGILVGHALSRRVWIAGQALLFAASILVGWIVLNDGVRVLWTLGPPAGQLHLFEAQRARSLVGAALAVVAVTITTVGLKRSVTVPASPPAT